MVPTIRLDETVRDAGSPGGPRQAKAGWLSQGGVEIPVIQGEDGEVYQVFAKGGGRRIIEELVVKRQIEGMPG